jgi:hypothetical protein
MIVVDAGLAAKWLIWEKGSEDAFYFLERFGREFCGPDLVFLEVASAMELQCDLATCDEKFQAKASKVHPDTKLLSYYTAQ